MYTRACIIRASENSLQMVIASCSEPREWCETLLFTVLLYAVDGPRQYQFRLRVLLQRLAYEEGKKGCWTYFLALSFKFTFERPLLMSHDSQLAGHKLQMPAT